MDCESTEVLATPRERFNSLLHMIRRVVTSEAG